MCPQNTNLESTGLRATLEAAMAEDGLKMKDLTVLAAQNDPFRVDTPAGHRDGEWLGMHFEKIGRERIHLRGLHYAVLGETKPDGSEYINTEENWIWLQSKAGKAARWLGYIPFERITDERNAEPVEREFKYPYPASYLSVGLDVEIPDAGDIEPLPVLSDFHGVQPFKLALFGEKTSLLDVLGPVAEARQADLYLPTGNASDTMIYGMARNAAEDGRPLVVFYFSDCDPAGWNMGIEVARKLQAFKALEFPELNFQLRPVALTPDQVREYGLPSTPLKESEKRAGAWREKMGVEQTEIDAIATLQPDLLHKIAMKATAPYFDSGLSKRVATAKSEWEHQAREVLREGIGEEELDRLHDQAAEKLASMEKEIEALNDELTVEVNGLGLPEVPDIPEAEVNGVDGLPSPLIDSIWDFGEQSKRLKAHKAYENGSN